MQGAVPELTLKGEDYVALNVTNNLNSSFSSAVVSYSIPVSTPPKANSQDLLVLNLSDS